VASDQAVLEGGRDRAVEAPAGPGLEDAAASALGLWELSLADAARVSYMFQASFAFHCEAAVSSLRLRRGHVRCALTKAKALRSPALPPTRHWGNTPNPSCMAKLAEHQSLTAAK
jgi:hypothetical protein